MNFGCLMYAAELIEGGVTVEAAREPAGFGSKSNFIDQFRSYLGRYPHEHKMNKVSHFNYDALNSSRLGEVLARAGALTRDEVE